MPDRRWYIIVLLLLGAALVSCGQAGSGTGQQPQEAPVEQQPHDPGQPTPQPTQPGEY